MPLFYQHNINLHTKLGIWHIAEGEDFFLEKVPLQREITHWHKRLQHLAGRYLLQELFADFPYELIEVADTRKPFLPNEAYHFSISHCGDYAAAIVSKFNRVGIDIELPRNKIEKIAHKFLSPYEMEFLPNHTNKSPVISYSNNQLLTLLWSAKEAIYKWSGTGGVDFIDHIHLLPEPIINNQGVFSGNYVKESNRPLLLNYHFFTETVLVWVETIQ